ncbi:7-cyano-7-deazaguanine synthase [Bradyrhizobium sp. CB1717]|uniref:7-cyano-7-deazaguanine synthase n=1 Tax=Bradyrhizobium sp. CB1717 TaxID=3039154 RepID=UPI0024B0B8A5|nr:7-cyano-7-deazaguanine synthase [Bradyrhizobium sp. CB1717]WFU23165.1 7-cyano-7-deazaguanine synthase [Bradyrhizobium sp. CB1717]
MSNATCILMLSGGVDSTVLALESKKTGVGVASAVFLDYGQESAARELHCARRTTLATGFAFEPVNISGLKYLFYGVIPSDYHPMMAECKCPDQAISHALVITYSILRGIDTLLLGTIKDDLTYHPGIKDYLPKMADAMSTLHRTKFNIVTPFIDMTKSDVIARGQKLGANFAETWACYSGGVAHCGECNGCINRQKAFVAAGVADTAPILKGNGVVGPWSG